MVVWAILCYDQLQFKVYTTYKIHGQTGLDIDRWPAGPAAFFTRRASSGQWI